eukprot:TRINITY_DN417_c0_g1_i1.p1 TRINITY_DN417_c0_g1~~TRINITY_DN417_c0_g1_i1.p1  ORF type:complete len:394 (+),score=111.52 TRINITY_DN417_c0_g1_i1:35-1216(+)
MQQVCPDSAQAGAVYDLSDIQDALGSYTEQQCPPLLDFNHTEGEEYSYAEDSELGTLAAHINSYTSTNGSVIEENLSIILSLKETQWNGRRFTGQPGVGITESLTAFFIKLARYDFRLPNGVQGFGEDPVLMDKITRHLLQRERKDRPDIGALDRPNTNSIQSLYRLMLIDWMVEVAMGWNLKLQTIHRAVLYVDRVFSNIKTYVMTSQVQLIGCTCLMLGCKMEEVNQDTVAKFSSVTGNSYTSKNIEDMEQKLTEVLGCRFSDVTICDFLLVYLEMLGVSNPACRGLCEVLSQVALHNLTLVAAMPSLVAMSCVFVGMHMTHHIFVNHWQPWMRRYFMHTSQELQDCVNMLLQFWGDYASKVPGTKPKYVLLPMLPSVPVHGGFVPPVSFV